MIGLMVTLARETDVRCHRLALSYIINRPLGSMLGHGPKGATQIWHATITTACMATFRYHPECPEPKDRTGDTSLCVGPHDRTRDTSLLVGPLSAQGHAEGCR